jgi:leader peptidase (prepilin peptidase)/N-methyltransferase
MATAPLAFFLIGIPGAFAIERLIRAFTDGYQPEADAALKALPWQGEPWASRLRICAVLPLPMLSAAAAARFEVEEAGVVSLIVGVLLVCAATDLLAYRVPNAITLPGMALALAASALLSTDDFGDSLLAIGLSAGFFLPMWALTGGGIGLADVKLAIFIAAALGLPAAYSALILGVIAGGLVMAALLIAGVVGRRQVTPYAPFLALSAIGVVFLQGTLLTPI